MELRRFWRLLSAIAVVALLLRCWAAWRYASAPNFDGDQWAHLYLGRAISHGQLFSPPAGPSLYAVFVAVCDLLQRLHLLPGPLPVTVAYTQALVGTVTVVLIGVVGLRRLGQAGGLIAAALFALWPGSVFGVVPAMTETVATFLVVTAVAWWTLCDPERKLHVVGFGIIVGLAAASRSNLLTLAAVPLLAGAGRGRGRVTARRTGLVALGLLVVVVPATIRGAYGTGHFVLLDDSAGPNLCLGNYSGATGGGGPWSACGVADDAEPSAYLSKAWHDFDPAREPALVVHRIGHLFNTDEFWPEVEMSHHRPGHRLTLTDGQRRAIGIAVHLLEVSALVAVLVAWRRRDRATLALALVPLAIALGPAISVGIERYRAPMDPILVLLAVSIAFGRASTCPWRATASTHAATEEKQADEGAESHPMRGRNPARHPLSPGPWLRWLDSLAP
jgi:hypothetical protein